MTTRPKLGLVLSFLLFFLISGTVAAAPKAIGHRHATGGGKTVVAHGHQHRLSALQRRVAQHPQRQLKSGQRAVAFRQPQQRRGHVAQHTSPRARHLVARHVRLSTSGTRQIVRHGRGTAHVPAQLPRYAQIAEPKAVAGIPDVYYEAARPARQSFARPSSPFLRAAYPSGSASASGVFDDTVSSVVDGSPEQRTALEGAPFGLSPNPINVRLGPYVGAAIGRGGLDARYEPTLQTIFATGATTAYVKPDVKNRTGKVYAGYRISPNWSLEGGYWDFGRPGYNASISAPVTTTMSRSFRLRGIGGGVVYWLPVTDAVSGFAKLGGMQVSAKAGSAAPAGLAPMPAQSTNTFNLHWGVGGEYLVRPDLALRLEYETVRKAGENSKFGTADLIQLNVGVAYKY